MSVKLDFWCPTHLKGDFQEGIRRAPDRASIAQAQTEIALKNAFAFILEIPASWLKFRKN